MTDPAIEAAQRHVDGYRFSEWTLIDAGCRISKLIEAHPGAVV